MNLRKTSISSSTSCRFTRRTSIPAPAARSPGSAHSLPHDVRHPHRSRGNRASSSVSIVPCGPRFVAKNTNLNKRFFHSSPVCIGFTATVGLRAARTRLAFRLRGDSVTTVLSFIVHRDQSLMRRINQWYAPRWIRLWMTPPRAAETAGCGTVGPLVLLFGGGTRFRAVAAAVIGAGSGVALFLRIKKWTNRPRPCTFAPHCWARLLPPDQFSFPSGHTITAFAVYPVAGPVLSGRRRRAAVLRHQRGSLAHHARNALPQRRSGRRRLGSHRAFCLMRSAASPTKASR